jgi:hypothetical protein
MKSEQESWIYRRGQNRSDGLVSYIIFGAARKEFHIVLALHHLWSHNLMMHFSDK